MPDGRLPALPRLRRLGLIAIAAHAVVLAFAHWLLYRQFLSRTFLDLAVPLRTAFAEYTLRVFAAEAAMLAAAAAALAAVRLVSESKDDPRRLAATAMLSYAGVALYGLVVIAAIAFGWEPDVFIMSAADATDADVIATIAEALPLVLQPLAWGRVAATVVAVVLFAVMQIRLCAVPPTRSAVTAVVAGGAAVAAQFLVAGVPESI